MPLVVVIAMFPVWEVSCLHLSLHQMTHSHLTAKSGYIKVVEYFVEQGPYIHIEDDNGVKIRCDHTYHTNSGTLADFECQVGVVSIGWDEIAWLV